MTSDISSAQCLRARALLGWSRDRLAPLVDISTDALGKFERERKALDPSCLTAIRMALEAAGIVFVHEKGTEPGVRLREDLPLKPI